MLREKKKNPAVDVDAFKSGKVGSPISLNSKPSVTKQNDASAENSSQETGESLNIV
jgi:hypothetical protein